MNGLCIRRKTKDIEILRFRNYLGSSNLNTQDSLDSTQLYMNNIQIAYKTLLGINKLKIQYEKKNSLLLKLNKQIVENNILINQKINNLKYFLPGDNKKKIGSEVCAENYDWENRKKKASFDECESVGRSSKSTGIEEYARREKFYNKECIIKKGMLTFCQLAMIRSMPTINV
ncbi:hypothetical protein SteCoe_2125 [Stentor coeruleus]|uniref:Uncharacterized protein n=1 Tax=Stentor coeruleus TaxID=5963 RepID=A0A1R2D066_9CILI|nr:hypothetical protein SteCoe_2125 [Stentor coeruleus]